VKKRELVTLTVIGGSDLKINIERIGSRKINYKQKRETKLRRKDLQEKKETLRIKSQTPAFKKGAAVMGR